MLTYNLELIIRYINQILPKAVLTYTNMGLESKHLITHFVFNQLSFYTIFFLFENAVP